MFILQITSLHNISLNLRILFSEPSNLAEVKQFHPPISLLTEHVNVGRIPIPFFFGMTKKNFDELPNSTQVPRLPVAPEVYGVIDSMNTRRCSTIVLTFFLVPKDFPAPGRRCVESVN